MLMAKLWLTSDVHSSRSKSKASSQRIALQATRTRRASLNPLYHTENTPSIFKEVNPMKELILTKLREIEQKENVRILHAVESGSRAWGFASPDSDYDVRFIYVRRTEDYLKLERTRDVIEWQLDETLDINGWDLQKMLRLLHKSNPTVFEWNASPVVYRTTPEWTALQPVIRSCFLKKPGLYHYLSMAKSNYREYLRGDTVRLKKYFYVLRPLLACRWILEKGTPPPVEFRTLMETCLPAELAEAVERLLFLKVNAPEIAEGPRVDALNDFIEKSLSELAEKIPRMSEDTAAAWDALNRTFYDILNAN